MDGENNGSKPYEQMDDLFFFPIFLETPIYTLRSLTWSKKNHPEKFFQVVFQAPFCQTSRVPGTLNTHTNNQYDSWKPQGIPLDPPTFSGYTGPSFKRRVTRVPDGVEGRVIASCIKDEEYRPGMFQKVVPLAFKNSHQFIQLKN